MEPLSHSHFAVLDVLGTKERSGREIRESLHLHNIKKDGPAFYHLMAQLQDDKLVDGWFEEEIIDEQIIKKRFFLATAKGIHAWMCTRDYHKAPTLKWQIREKIS